MKAHGEETPGGRSGGGQGDASGVPLIHGTDLWLCLVILAGCAALYFGTTQFEKVADLFAQDVPPEFFPRLLIWTIVVLTVLLPFEHLYLRRRQKDIDKDRRKAVRPIAYVTAALLCVVVASISVLGPWLTMTLVCVALPLLWHERRLKVIIPFAVIFPALVTLLFSTVLEVHFEPGYVLPALSEVGLWIR
jgi:putative tricarboxylic transport membrane protein